MSKPGTRFRDLVSDGAIRPLDVVLFRDDDFVSSMIAKEQRSTMGIPSKRSVYSHIGIVVDRTVLPNVTEMRHGELYVWESTVSGRLLGKGVPNIYGGAHLGVQVRHLDTLVQAYDEKPDTFLGWAPLLPHFRRWVDEHIYDVQVHMGVLFHNLNGSL